MSQINPVFNSDCSIGKRGRGFTAGITLCGLSFIAVLLLAGGSWGAGGDLLWESHFDAGGGENNAFALVAKGKRVFAVGQVETKGGAQEWMVRAHEGKTGALLWENQFDSGAGNSEGLAITAKGKRVFAAGQGETEEGGFEWVVRAHDGKKGMLLWEDRFGGGSGVFNGAGAITVRGKRVFAAGFSDGDWVVRAYDGKTGVLLWQDRFDTGLGFNGVLAITAKGDRVFAAGHGYGEWVVRAYDAKTGALLWDDQFEGTGGLDTQANAITAKGKRVFVAGFVETEGGVDWLVRGYDGKTGVLLWEDQFEYGEGVNNPMAITAKGRRVFAAGFVEGQEFTFDWAVRAYDAKTGAFLWDDRIGMGGPNTQANAITAKGKRVFAAGSTDLEGGSADWVVRASDAKTGAFLWEDQFDYGGSSNSANAITAKGKRVFAAGQGETEGGVQEWVVRAYRTH